MSAAERGSDSIHIDNATLRPASGDGLGVTVLEPSSVRLRQTSGGLLEATVGNRTYGGAEINQAFPRSQPDHFLILSDAEHREIGIIEDISKLDGESIESVGFALRVHYLIPVVTHIRQIRQQPGNWTWEVVTDRGPMRLILRNLHDHLETLGPDRILLTDIDGRSCEIRSADLDLPSRRRLSRVL
jgi:hypothetical protein